MVYHVHQLGFAIAFYIPNLRCTFIWIEVNHAVLCFSYVYTAPLFWLSNILISNSFQLEKPQGLYLLLRCS